jgi:pilus assembly protein CpaE
MQSVAPKTSALKTLVVSGNPQLFSDLKGLLAATSGIASTAIAMGPLATLDATTTRDQVDLLLLDCSGDDAPEQLVQLERLVQHHPRLDTMLLVRDGSADLLVRAIRAGVKEVVRLPLDGGEFKQAIARIQSKRRASIAARSGRVLAFTSCKGGSGATFVAANLGYALAAHTGASVLLIDLNLQFGDSAMYLAEQPPKSTIADVASTGVGLDPALLRSAAMEVLPNYWVLAGPDDLALSSDIKPAHVAALVRLARGLYDFVLLDVGRSLDAMSLQVLDLADEVYPVLQMTLPYLRDGKRLMAVFTSLEYPADKIRPIVNRFEKVPDLTVADLERAIGRSSFAFIPNHYRTAAGAINRGLPVEKFAPGSPIARAFKDLAETVNRTEATSRGSSWLRRILQR